MKLLNTSMILWKAGPGSVSLKATGKVIDIFNLAQAAMGMVKDLFHSLSMYLVWPDARKNAAVLFWR